MKKIETLFAGLFAGVILAGRGASPRRCPISAADGRRGHRERLFPAAVRRSEDRQARSAGNMTRWTELAKRLNFKVEYQNTSWDAMIQAVSDKQYDIGMTGITIKDDRKEKVDFSDPYMRSEIFMLVRGDETRFTDAKSFRRRREAAGRRAGRHLALLRRRLQRARRQRANPRIKLLETFARDRRRR